MMRVFVFLLLGACSGSGEPHFEEDGGADATADVKSNADATNDVLVLGDTLAEVGPTDAAGVDAADPDLACATDDAGCVSCCFDRHADGAATYFDTLVNCACHTGATCHSASVCLNNLCKGLAPTQTCDNCLSNPDAGDCYNNADKACGKDVDCIAFFDCVDNVCAPSPADASAD